MTSGLRQRIGLTIGALLVYRLGTQIPLPGIDLRVWNAVFQQGDSGILEMSNLLAGGAVRRLALLALGVTPYVSAAILLQLSSTVSSRLRSLNGQGERGRSRMVEYTRWLAVLLAFFQGYGVAGGLESVAGVVTDPGLLFRISTALTLTAGTVFLIWIVEQITARGIGNGLSLVLFAGVATELPVSVAGIIELSRRGSVSTEGVLATILAAVALIGFIVVVEQARRRLSLEFPGRKAGEQTLGGGSDLLLKLNSAGLIPAIVTAWLLAIPLTIASFMLGHNSLLMRELAAWFGHGRPLFLVFYAISIVVCALLYTAFVINPDAAADRLKQLGGVLPGVEPGESTAEYLDEVLSRVALLGAVYLVLVCLIPELLLSYANLPFYFSGISLLVAVCVTLDLKAQLQGTALRNLRGERS